MILNEEGIRVLFDCLANNEPRLKVVQQEQPDSAEPDPDAETFLKYDGSRWGRDLELYASVLKIIEPRALAATLLEEIFLPLKESSPQAFAKGIETLSGYDVGEDPGAWQEMLDSLAHVKLADYFYPVDQQRIPELYSKVEKDFQGQISRQLRLSIYPRGIDLSCPIELNLVLIKQADDPASPTHSDCGLQGASGIQTSGVLT